MAKSGNRTGLARAGGMALLAALSLGACNPTGAKPGSDKNTEITKAADPVVAATVNGKPIFVDDVLVEATVRGLIKVGDPFPQTSPEFYQILQDLIETRLMANEAEARGLDKQPDVRHRLDVARERILAGVLNEDLREDVLKEDKIRDYYREQMRIRGEGALVRVRHIVLRTRESAAAAKVRLDRGEPFETVAYEASIDRTTGGEGGDLGFRDPSSFPDAVQDLIKGAQLAQILGPVQTEAGWHLLRVDERKSAEPPTLESMRRQIEANLIWPEQRRVVERLKGQARIELFIDQGVAAPQRPEIAPPPGVGAPGSAMPAPADAPAVPMGPAGAAGGGGAPPTAEAPAPAKPQPGKPAPPAGAAPRAAPKAAPAPPPAPAAPPPAPVEREL